jgi:flagellar motility protein MotE (MotC chaperone)
MPMKPHLPLPRLLPVTIAAMALVLGVRSVVLVRAASPAPAAMPAPAPASPLIPPPPPPAPPAAPPPLSDAERALLLDLRKRSAALDAREAEAKQRDAVLAAAEARLTARLGELTGLQKRLEALEAARQARDEANWRGLVKLYESMKPADAGRIFNDLDLPVLLPILDRMKAAKAAAVLSAMQPERARLVTAELAQLRARENAAPGPAGG